MRHAREDFEKHWRNAPADLAEAKLREARAFLEPARAGLLDLDYRSVVCVDVGCGDGIHAAAIMPLAPAATYLGIDLSESALKAARGRIPSVSTWVVADGHALPVASGSADLVVAYGVLGYDSAPKEIVVELARICRSGGLVGIWVAPRPPGIMGAMFFTLRRVVRLLPPIARRLIVSAIVPFLGFLPTRSGVSLRNATWYECVEVIGVNLLPQYLEFHDELAVREWMSLAGLTPFFSDPDRPVAVWARR